MKQKTQFLMLAIFIIVVVGFMRVLTSHGQEYVTVGSDGVNVETCKDFNKLSDAQQEAWVDGYNTAVVSLVDEKQSPDYQVDDAEILGAFCEENQKMEITDAISLSKGLEYNK